MHSLKPNPKVLLLYGGMVLSTTLLFRSVAAYGEKHLQAQPNINGQYVSLEPLPGCPADRHLVLTIQQSGLFLSGHLQVAAVAALPSAESKPLLSGNWRSGQMQLVGQAPALSDCQLAAAGLTNVQIRGQFGSAEGSPAATDRLTAEITLAGQPPLRFIADRQTQPAQSNSH